MKAFLLVNEYTGCLQNTITKEQLRSSVKLYSYDIITGCICLRWMDKF
jgi:hypothetical protein